MVIIILLCEHYIKYVQVYSTGPRFLCLGSMLQEEAKLSSENLTRFVYGAEQHRVKVMTANPSSHFGTKK